MLNKRLPFLAASLIIFISTVSAQRSLWSNIEVGIVDDKSVNGRNLVTGNSILSKLDLPFLRSILKSVSQESSDGKFVLGTPFTIPMPSGETLKTSILESSIWSAGSVVPGIKTYVLVNPTTKSLDGRITITPEGISGILFSGNGAVYINPLRKGNEVVHIISKTNVSYKPDNMQVDGPVCISNEVRSVLTNVNPNTYRTNAGDCKRRTYRLAVATTAEYTSWAGSQANAMAYLTITVNNVMAIFSRDLNIRFSLVTNNSILFTNAATDPYPEPGLSAWQIPASNANQTALDTYIGTNGYDVGIVFSRGWGAGYAPTGATCKAADKGKSAAGIDNGQGLNPVAGPQGFVFDFTIAHELGHMFGASHTFASNAGFCAPYGNFATAYEPGAGSTLMTYAPYATCGSYVSYIEPYFHAGSIAQMNTYLNTTTCAAITANENSAPLVNVAAASYTLPVSTPFTLTANGSDPDGNTLLYNWEQMDAAFTATPPPGTNATGPNFRSYAPTTTGNIRTFPRIQDIAGGINTPFEKLTSVTRAMHFRVTARDQAATGGCTAEANVTLNFNSGAGPFTVTSQPAPVTWVANGANTETITWNVASTNLAPVNCSAVNILFSVNGGITYPYTLISNTPNDGSEIITVPNIPTQSGRIKVEPVNNIFFNINAANITVNAGCVAEGTTFTPAQEVSAPAGSAALNLALTAQYGSAFTPAGTITSGNPSTLLPIYNNAIQSCAVYAFNGSFRYNVHPFVVVSAGTYSFNIPAPFGLVYNLYREAYNPAFPCYNFIASNTVTGNSPTVINPTVSAALVPGNRYVLVVGTFSSSFPALPANYTVNVTGGSVYSNPPSPGAAFNYLYVVVDNATNLIKSIAPAADLSSGNTYPGGTGYSVYGLSYSNASPSLAAFIGGSYSALTNALFNNASYCGNISKNILKVNVGQVFTFIGNGNWSDAANWSNNLKPPDPLPAGAEIIINPSGECVLNVPIVFPANVKLTVIAGKTLKVN